MEERQNNATLLRRAELFSDCWTCCLIKRNSIEHLIEQKMLDENLPTWAAKQSNNVEANKVNVGALNPTSFDSLTRASNSLLSARERRRNAPTCQTHVRGVQSLNLGAIGNDNGDSNKNVTNLHV